MSDRDAGYTDVIGFDIGGANLKLYHSRGWVQTVPFAMWRMPSKLADRLSELVDLWPPAFRWVVTMTGELADCFADRAAGVQAIVQQVEKAAAKRRGTQVFYYAIPERSGAADCFLQADQAVLVPYRVASANWHATAMQLALQVGSQQTAAPHLPLHHRAIMIDIGSTTTDLIPILPGKVASHCQTDYERLRDWQLVYVGGERTSVCSLVSELPFRGRQVPVMREFFADIGDCAVLLGLRAPSPDNELADDAYHTADGKPRTMEHCHARLARMIGLDHSQVSAVEAKELSWSVAQAATDLIGRALHRLDPDGSATLYLLGHQRWMLTHAVQQNRTCVKMYDSEPIARVGPAYALCQLYQHRDRSREV